jgi:hypothetical protein
MFLPSSLRAVARLLVCSGAALTFACSSSTSVTSDAGTLDATKGTTNTSSCKDQGYVCQSGSTCSAGYINEQDLNCGTGGDLCCGPVGEGGLDASDDANVFIDGAVFETGPDVTVKKPADAGTDAGTDATTKPPVDAGVDASHVSPDSGSDAAKDAVADVAPGQ